MSKTGREASRLRQHEISHHVGAGAEAVVQLGKAGERVWQEQQSVAPWACACVHGAMPDTIHTMCAVLQPRKGTLVF